MASITTLTPPVTSRKSLLDLPNELIEEIAALVSEGTRFDEDEADRWKDRGRALQGLMLTSKRLALLSRPAAFQVRRFPRFLLPDDLAHLFPFPQTVGAAALKSKVFSSRILPLHSDHIRDVVLAGASSEMIGDMILCLDALPNLSYLSFGTAVYPRSNLFPSPPFDIPTPDFAAGEA